MHEALRAAGIPVEVVQVSDVRMPDPVQYLIGDTPAAPLPAEARRWLAELLATAEPVLNAS